MEGGASGFASDPALFCPPSGIATDPAAGVSKNARTGSAKAVSQNAPDRFPQARASSTLGQGPDQGSASATPLPLAPRGAANARQQPRQGDAAHERLAISAPPAPPSARGAIAAPPAPPSAKGGSREVALPAAVEGAASLAPCARDGVCCLCGNGFRWIARR